MNRGWLEILHANLPGVTTHFDDAFQTDWNFSGNHDDHQKTRLRAPTNAETYLERFPSMPSRAVSGQASCFSNESDPQGLHIFLLLLVP